VASFKHTQVNPPRTADGMTVTRRFDEGGAVVASAAERQKIGDFATVLLNALRLIQPQINGRYRTP
jgi:hypothetical protein